MKKTTIVAVVVAAGALAALRLLPSGPRIECRLEGGDVVVFPADAGRGVLDDSRLSGKAYVCERKP
jgi:hypothetical protein